MRERSPKDFYESRVAQLKDNTPIVGKMRRKKAMEEICHSRFEGWYEEKVNAIILGLENDDAEVRKIAENYLHSLDYETTGKNIILILCDRFLETKNPKILMIIKARKLLPKFDSMFKTIEFYSCVYGSEVTQKTIARLSFRDCLDVYNKTKNVELKKQLFQRVRETTKEENIPEIFDAFMRNISVEYLEFLDKYFEKLSFQDKIRLILHLPGIKGYSGDKQKLTESFVNRLEEYIKAHPATVDGHYAITEYVKNPMATWILEILERNRDILSVKNELVLCNHYKQYDKVRKITNDFTAEELCEYFSYFLGTPLECIFQQKLLITIKKLNYAFNFNLLKNYFEFLDETIKMEVFKLLSNFSVPTYFDFVIYQMNKISRYTPEELRYYIDHIVPYYIPMLLKMREDDQQNSLKKIENIDHSTLDFFINKILLIQAEARVIRYLENLLKLQSLTEEQKLIAIEIVLSQRPEIIANSELLKTYKAKYVAKIETLKKFIEELEKQCSRKYLRDDTTGINEEIDRKRNILVKEIQKIDTEKSIELLIQYYNEKNYRMKKDVRRILESTHVGYKVLIPYALTSGIDDKDL